ncbi:MAG: hypothetical protein WC455_19530 [Dehalococcoidia bacterium]|jgi:hypothetical protein
MSTVERIQELLNCTSRIPEKDKAGIITAHGVDCTVRIKALNDCLKIAKDEEGKSEFE